MSVLKRGPFRRTQPTIAPSASPGGRKGTQDGILEIYTSHPGLRLTSVVLVAGSLTCLSTFFWTGFAQGCTGDRDTVGLLDGSSEFQTPYVYAWVGWLCFSAITVWTLAVATCLVLRQFAPSLWSKDSYRTTLQRAALHSSGIGCYLALAFCESIVAWSTDNFCDPGPLGYVGLSTTAAQLIFTTAAAAISVGLP